MQNISKIRTSHTIKVEDKNHRCWHQGIKQYGFWAIVINDKSWLSIYEQARKHVSNLVLPDYQRQAHLTLSACGLIDKKHFTENKLKQQIRVLQDLELSEFYINLQELDSFETAPYISVGINDELNKIRKALESIRQDDPALEFKPHLTLGFYKQALPIASIREHLLAHSLPSAPALLVDTLCYCTYQTDTIQGKFSIQFELSLKTSLPAHCPPLSTAIFEQEC
jgi:2'-5' RNA ligase